MTSGVKCDDEVTTLFDEMRLVKKDSNNLERIRLVVFEIVDSVIKPIKTFRQKDLNDEENVFKVFVNQMPGQKCRYLLYDCHYTTVDSPKQELVLVMWTPDTSCCKEKMIYASSKSSIKGALHGVKHVLEFNDASDHAIEAFAETFGRDVALQIEGHDCGCKKH